VPEEKSLLNGAWLIMFFAPTQLPFAIYRVARIALTTVVLALNFIAWSQASETGKAEFLSNCATCHGIDGRGSGPLAARLKSSPPDLTLLAKKNHGVYPSDEVYQMIDGREGARNHRGMEMPIWGCRHESPHVPLRRAHGKKAMLRNKVRAPTVESLLDLPCDSESAIKARILSIVDYLGHIQQK
jgi:hypothetical protein